MKKFFLIAVIGIVAGVNATAQRFIKVNQDDRRLWLNVGIGPGFLKAGNAYDLKPLFLTNAGLGWQIFASPYYMASNRFNVGLKLGGIFRPAFEDVETNSRIDQKFTSYGFVFADYYLSSPYRILERPFKPRFYVGVSAGVSYIGLLAAKDLATETYYTFRRRDQDAFLSVAPKIGLSFRKVKIEIEHIVTTPFNPDFTSFSIISAIPLGAPRFY